VAETEQRQDATFFLIGPIKLTKLRPKLIFFDEESLVFIIKIEFKIT
jgi:hypothetical protein